MDGMLDSFRQPAYPQHWVTGAAVAGVLKDINMLCVHLGMDAEEDAGLRWIAEQAFDAPLPEGWSEHFDDDGKVYFAHAHSKSVTRDHPLDDYFRQMVIRCRGGASPAEASASYHAEAQLDKSKGAKEAAAAAEVEKMAHMQQQLDRMEAEAKIAAQQAENTSAAMAATVERAYALAQSGNEQQQHAVEAERMRATVAEVLAKLAQSEAEMAQYKACVETEELKAAQAVQCALQSASDEQAVAQEARLKLEEATANSEAREAQARPCRHSLGDADGASDAVTPLVMRMRSVQMEGNLWRQQKEELSTAAENDAATRAQAAAEQQLEEAKEAWAAELARHKEESARELSDLRTTQSSELEQSERAAATALRIGNAAVTAAWRKELENLRQTVGELQQEQASVRADAMEVHEKQQSEVGSAVLACSSLSAQLREEQEHKVILTQAVVECEARMGPLIRERRRLFNEVMRAKGNIRVFCRVRPLSDAETQAGAADSVSFPEDDGAKRHIHLQTSATGKPFAFDRVFQPDISQEEVFADVQPLIQAVMDGWNVCVFAYGQTGSGKTHTMEGSEGNRGVTVRAFEELFELAQQSWGIYSYDFKVSIIEIYNETIRDLLVKKGGASKKHDIKTNEAGQVYITDLSHATATGPADFKELMRTAGKNRSTGATKMNEGSSRSHLVMGITVTMSNKASGETLTSKLSLVDLAGSERQDKTGATGERLKESLHINKSLSALGDVISALTARHAHVPFRNSKLTHLLCDSLGNDCKTLLFVNVSPASTNLSESACSLQFAARARNVDLSGGAPHLPRARARDATPSRDDKERTRGQQPETELQRELNKARAENEDLRRKGVAFQEDMEQQLAKLSADYKSAKQHHKDVKTEYKAALAAITAREKTISALRQQMAEIKAEEQHQQAEEEGEEEDSDEAQEGGTPDGESRVRARLKAHISSAGGTLKTAEDKVAELQQLLLAKDNELASKSAELSALRCSLQESGASSLSQSPEKLKRQMAELSAINKQLLDKCKATKAEKGKLQEELRNMHRRLQALQGGKQTKPPLAAQN
ncbi:hypothetical protein CYMTET_49229 [Cymbomonas tetramitiformis]|uniref:Kinesin-like protein n=1 Tax=Cymbomonas tetramitiformis TaxID=36881 RepID=A0AAE0BQM7_9CHLO|nr:hypothetical protein CYMTET_49229 [Cymbomonas tetramitiformis]